MLGKSSPHYTQEPYIKESHNKEPYNKAPLRRLTGLDKVVKQIDTIAQTLCANKTYSVRANPAASLDTTYQGTNHLSHEEQAHSAGLMRVNHTGEVCAQALYQGQALTAKLPKVRQEMEQAATEEEDHLAWCQTRLNQLQASPSKLNPLWYGLSLGIGAGAGLLSDRLSLGFVAATEEQVCQHLDSHLSTLPESDKASRIIVKQMREDEAEHAAMALKAGGIQFSQPVKRGMSLVARIMTWTSYRI